MRTNSSQIRDWFRDISGPHFGLSLTSSQIQPLGVAAIKLDRCFSFSLSQATTHRLHTNLTLRREGGRGEWDCVIDESKELRTMMRISKHLFSMEFSFLAISQLHYTYFCSNIQRREPLMLHLLTTLQARYGFLLYRLWILNEWACTQLMDYETISYKREIERERIVWNYKRLWSEVNKFLFYLEFWCVFWLHITISLLAHIIPKRRVRREGGSWGSVSWQWLVKTFNKEHSSEQCEYQ